MPKYVGNSQYDRPKRDFSDKLAYASEGVAKGIEAYGKIKQSELAQKTLADPASTPIQKAMALASIGQEKLGTEIFKKSADDATLSGIETRLRENLGVNPVDAPRDRSWRPEIAQQETTAQPGAEGTGSPTQPGFSVNGPQNAARNPTALNQQVPVANVGVPQGGTMPQAQQQVDPQREAAAYEQAALETAPHNHPLAVQYANRAKEIRKDLRAKINADKDLDKVLRKELIDIHQSFDKEDKAINAAAKQATGQMHAFDTMRKDIASKKLTPTNFQNLVRKALENTRWKDFLLNPKQAEFQAASLESYEGMKEMFGGKITDADLRLASGKVPDLNKTDEANLAIIDFMEFKDKMKVAEAEIGDEIKRENGGYRPIDYTSQIP